MSPRVKAHRDAFREYDLTGVVRHRDALLLKRALHQTNHRGTNLQPECFGREATLDADLNGRTRERFGQDPRLGIRTHCGCSAITDKATSGAGDRIRVTDAHDEIDATSRIIVLFTNGTLYTIEFGICT